MTDKELIRRAVLLLLIAGLVGVLAAIVLTDQIADSLGVKR